MFQLLHWMIQLGQAVIVPLCFLSAWVLVAMTVWSLWSAIRDTAVRTQQMHQIPCANCQFFTSDYHLKCTVHPSTALTEAAIGCPDYEARQSLYSPDSVR